MWVKLYIFALALNLKFPGIFQHATTIRNALIINCTYSAVISNYYLPESCCQINKLDFSHLQRIPYWTEFNELWFRNLHVYFLPALNLIFNSKPKKTANFASLLAWNVSHQWKGFFSYLISPHTVFTVLMAEVQVYCRFECQVDYIKRNPCLPLPLKYLQINAIYDLLVWGQFSIISQLFSYWINLPVHTGLFLFLLGFLYSGVYYAICWIYPIIQSTHLPRWCTLE